MWLRDCPFTVVKVPPITSLPSGWRLTTYTIPPVAPCWLFPKVRSVVPGVFFRLVCMQSCRNMGQGLNDRAEGVGGTRA